MRKTKSKSYLQTYYGSEQAAVCPARVVLCKTSDRPALKEKKNRKGLYALGSN